MKYIFYQNIISPHQAPFLCELAKINEVTLCVEREIAEERREQGWSQPHLDNIHLIVTPSDKLLANIISSNDDAIHVFSGIRAYPMVYRAFKMAAKANRRIFVFGEPYRWIGLKGVLRRVMWSYLFWRYESSIEALLTTGNCGVRCFTNAGFPVERIYQWGYFPKIDPPLSNYSDKQYRILFIGQLIERKKILPLISTLKRCVNYSHFSIVGRGVLESRVREQIADDKRMEYLGVVENSKILETISRYDLLVLPSLFDGWGAVVNEALGCGTRVLCSKNCGAGILLDGKDRGGIIGDNMVASLQEWIDKGVVSPKQREEIREWADKSISPRVAARYFEELTNNRTNRMVAPWLANNSASTNN